MNDRMTVPEARHGDDELRAILQEARGVGEDNGGDSGQVHMAFVLHGAAAADA